MVGNMNFPIPLQRKMLITAAIGAACFVIGFAVFLFLKDQTTLLLSVAVLVMCLGQSISLYRIASTQTYEVVEGICIAIAPKPLRKYRKVILQDVDGNELSLLLDKHSKLQIGSKYRFYFKEADRITFGKEYFDSVLNADCFLGFEEVSTFNETQCAI